ncbi:permease prefix domain 1-containing protein [Microbacterium atlanticum]|uniref:permease prefix domain 1-containing protein n=1 Tax=Microbacterium atlanticum TaxID=2782168 RepID=UPI0018890941|nr:permease prefix domain 1-containing protein [Microbacterium atlanticum]
MHTTPATLTDRYVDAALRTVPENQRADLGAELRASIDDQVEARVAQGEPPADAERAVLVELGDPDKLAAQYTDRPLWLVGPRYFLTWWRLTKLLWAIVPVCAAFGVALGQTLSGAGFGEIVGSVVSVVLSVIVHIGFWTTLVFFVVERSTHSADVGLVSSWTPDDLPEPRERGTGLGDLVASLVFLAIAAGAILWDHFVGFAYSAETGWTSFLAPSLWPWWIGGLFAVMLLEALLTISVYAKGRWDLGSATVNLFLNLTVAGGALWLLSQQQLINPVFFDTVIPAESADTVTTVVTTVFAFGIVAIAAWDTADAYLKAARARR